MTDSQHRTDGSRVDDFARALGLTLANGDLSYRATDRILGFVNEGKRARRWKIDGIPPYVVTLMGYIQTFGPELAEELAKKRDAVIAEAKAKMTDKKWYTRAVPVDEFRVPAATIFRWRDKHKLSQPMFDRMFGMTSRGRSCRLWEEKGAPPYVEFFLAYADKYGTDFAFQQVEERGQAIPKTALGVA